MMHIYKIIAQPMKKIQQRHALYRILCFLSEQENFQQTFGEWHFGGRRWLEAIQSGKWLKTVGPTMVSRRSWTMDTQPLVTTGVL